MKNVFGSLERQLAYYTANPGEQLNEGACTVLRSYSDSVRNRCRLLVIKDIPYMDGDLSKVIGAMVNFLRYCDVSEFVFAESSTSTLGYLFCLLGTGCSIDSAVCINTMSPYSESGVISGLRIKIVTKRRG